MEQKIRYRLVHNYAGRLNRDGLAPVALECRQGARKMYMSSRILIRPDQWRGGMVVNHDNAGKLTAYLVRWRNSVEEVELDMLLRGKGMTLLQLREAVRLGMRQSASVREFMEAVIMPSDRKKATKRSYVYLCNELEKEYGRVTLSDITHDLIEKWRNAMRDAGLSENTIKGRLKQLHCLTQEAIKRNVISDDPFVWIKIGNMTPRIGHLTLREMARLEGLELTGSNAHVRDAFVFCCYTGLRYSDFTSLKDSFLTNGVLSLRQQKTRSQVCIPLRYLFGGKPLLILGRYRSVESFSRIGCNTTVNRRLKTIAEKARIVKNISFHLARHTAATLLNQAGLQIQEIQKILGHRKMETTEKSYAETTVTQVSRSLKKAFRVRNKSGE